MKVALMRLSVCAWIFGFVLGASAAAADKPNILVVITDDHAEEMITGRDASGRPFLPFIASKVSLARQFERSYYAQPLCCPSRVSMLTGRYPHNHGVRANTGANGGYDRYMANGLDAVSWP
ncbi:MAG TPA: sulfatase-like hydrolase/transferase, partial [Xanthobacteraceae bacterium]|nr:sulfatase-like hydrolase/transferase [Xanthobacteraceae bacterium]